MTFAGTHFRLPCRRRWQECDVFTGRDYKRANGQNCVLHRCLMQVPVEVSSPPAKQRLICGSQAMPNAKPQSRR